MLSSGRIAGLRDHHGQVIAQAVWAPIISEQVRGRILARMTDLAVSGRRTPRRWTSNRRCWLRRLLSGYLDIDPAGIVFGENTFGEPRLTAPSQQRLRFNVSHSEGLAVFAVARGREVGVDVERVRDDLPVEAVARFFSLRDQEVLAALPLGHRVDVAFALWTRKEAYLKGIGVGFATEHGGREHPGHERGDWTVRAFDAGTGFAAAVAVEGLGVEVPDAVRPLWSP